MGRTRIAKAVINDLKEKKEVSQKRKNELIDYLKRLNQAHINEKISGAQYVETLHKKNDGRNIKEWVDYYENYSKNCEKEIKKQERTIISKKIPVFLFSILLISFLIYLSISTSFFHINFTGLFVGEQKEQAFSQSINLITNESTTYEWQLENLGQLSSVKINGLIEGEGEVRIYLNDLLIMDSSKTESKSAPLTGGVISEGSEGTIVEENPIVGPTEKTQETQDTASETQTQETNKSNSEKEAPSKEESSPSQGELLTETSQTNSQTTSQENTNTTNQDTNQSYSEKETPSKEESSPSQGESLTENQTINNSNSEAQTQTGQPGSQATNESEALPKEESSPSQEEPQTSESNITDIQNETITEIQNQTLTIIKKFVGVCTETCNLSGLNLNESSYTLRIEVTNAKLQLDTIDYSIIPEEIPQEINVTNVSLIENATINTTQYQAVLGQPVKWKKEISLNESGSTIVELPKEATNIVVKKIIESNSEEQKIQKNSTSSEEINQSEALPKEESSPSQEEPQTSENGIIKQTVNANIETKIKSSDEEPQKQTPSKITGNAVSTSEETSSNQTEITQVSINDNATNYEITYETPAPYAVEEDLENGKRVIVSGPETIHYENVLSFTELDESLNIKNPSSIKIHWIENNTYISPTKIEDKDNNGVYDYIEWVVPHLSNQTFDIIIITKAEHLDSNRTFISDIYEQVKALDNVWSETINSDEYIRVTFEIPLDNTRDITLYPRVVSGTPKIEVYEIDGTTKIAEFNPINDNVYNKIYLTNLQESQDTFDLKILNGSVEFDHIIDPTTITFEEPPTPENGSTVTYQNITIVANISESTGANTSSWMDFDRDLLLWISFEGNTLDNSSYNWTNANNGIGYTQGRFGQSGANFTETKKVQVNANLDYAAGNTTISFWMYVINKGTPNRQNPLGKAYGGDGTFTLEPAGTINFYWGSSGIDGGSYTSLGSTAGVTIGVWEHWAITRDRTQRKVTWYKNGAVSTAATSYVSTYDPKHSTINLTIGDNYCSSLNGSIDEVMIFNRTLALTEIKALYDSKVNKFNASLGVIGSEQHNYTVYAINQLGEVVSEGKNFIYSDINSPTYSQASTNITIAGQINKFAINVNDNSELHPNGRYIFSTNNTGVWVNDSTVDFTTTPSWANLTEILNSTVGIRIGYMWYFNDTVDNTNSTPIYTLLLTNDNIQPTYSEVSINNTLAGQINKFAIKVSDNMEIHPNGGYIFSTNNTWGNATWSNDSFVLFTTTPSWANLTKILNSTAGTSVGYRWYFNDTFNNKNSTPIYVLNKPAYNTWITNLTLNVSLPDIGANSAPSVFYKDSSWYLISGAADGKFYGYVYDDVNDHWDVNITINASLPDIGSNSMPDVFQKDGTWYIIAGNDSGLFNGFDYNSSNMWHRNSTINASLPDIGSNSVPDVFQKDGTWYLISGNSVGNFNGYVYDDTNDHWDVNITINASLPDIGSNSAPYVFYKDSSWYLISGNSVGNFNGYVYDDVNDHWDVNITINASLPIIGTWSTPDAFYKDSNWYLISGNVVGNFNGYIYYVPEATAEADSTPPKWFSNSTNSTVTGGYILHSVNWTDETALSGYIFSFDNGTGTLVNDSWVSFIGTENWSNVTKVVNTTAGSIIRWIVYANDSSNNLNSTSIFQYTTTDTTPPTISFESPTPDNASTVNVSSQTIVANISDASNTSSWIDFDRSLVGYWAMDYYNSTGIFDNSSYGNNGTFQGGLNYSNLTTGARGQGLMFDGGDDYIDVGNKTSLNITGNQITIEAWIYPKLLDERYIVSKAVGDNILDGYNLFITSNAFYFRLGNGTTRFQLSVLHEMSINNWYHIVAVYNGTEMKIYKNGVALPDSTAFTGNIGTNTNVVKIGRATNDAAYNFNGSIDEVMIFNRSLSLTEIKALYDSQSNKFNTSAMSLANGQHNYTVYTIDASGNAANSGLKNFIVSTVLQCGDSLNVAGTTYTLTSNVTSTGVCFQIGAANITLDCNGYWITYSTGGESNTHAIFTNQFNTTIKNCNIVDGNWTNSNTYRPAISIDTSDNSTIINNFVNASNTYAIYLNNGANFNNLTNNTGISNSSTGIGLSSSSNNTLTNNTGISKSGGAGISIDTSSNNTLVNCIGNATSSGGGNNVGIWLDSSNYNSIINSTAQGNMDNGLRLISSQFNNITNTRAISNTNAAVTFENSSYNIAVNITSISGTSPIGMYLGPWYDGVTGFSFNNTIINSTIQILDSTWINLDLNTNSTNNTFIGNTFISNNGGGALIYLVASANNNLFYWNNFTSTSYYYVQDMNGSNKYNTTINGKNEGNIWYNVMSGSLDITGNVLSSYGNGFYIGNTGSKYPYNGSNSGSKVTANVIDYAPLTLTATPSDSTAPIITFEEPPTPINASSNSSSPVTIVANISDASNTSSFIDFDRSLVGYWAMDYYNATEIFDNSTYKNNGTFQGGLSSSDLTTGARGQALDFDGSDGYIKVPDSSTLDFPVSGTVSLWVNAGSSLGGYDMPFSRGGGSEGDVGYDFELGTNSWVTYVANGISMTPCYYSYAPLVGWQMLTFTFDTTTNALLCYVNGVNPNIYNGDITGFGGINSSQSISIGVPSYPLNGSVDEVMIFNRSLSQSEISALYNSQSNKFNASFTNLSSGQHNYTVYAIDASGNAANSGWRYFTVDATPPTIAFEIPPTPSNGSTTSNPATIVANISDASNTSSFIDFDKSLLGYWSMDYYNATGIFDNSSYGNNGTFVNGLGTSNLKTGIRGNALDFDGNNSRLKANPINLNQNNFSVFTWIYKKGTTNTLVPLMEQGGNTKFRLIYSGSQLCFGNDSLIANFYCTSWGTISENNQWYFIGGVVENGVVRIYVNGINTSYSNYSNNYGSLDENFLYIGDRDYTEIVDAWNGSIDEAMIFNRSLSQSEISALYNSKVNKFNASFTNLTQGQHNYTVYAIDEAGNMNNSGLKNFVVNADSTPPTYNMVSTNNTVAGQITNFAINVTDETALQPNGMYVFSTNNSGSWINDSIFGAGNYWQKDTAINASLSDIGGYSVASVFYKDSSWYLMTGRYEGLFPSYAWNGTNWLPNSTINRSLPNFVASSPYVFYKDSSWYMLSGSEAGITYGYAWNGTDWNVNTTINKSMPNTGAYNRLSIFQKDETWYMLIGKQTGDVLGFNYNGTDWKPNSTINNSFASTGADAHPNVFYKDSVWYTLLGGNSGNFNGYAWNGIQWLPNSVINASLLNIGGSTKPYVFYKDSSWYMIAGNSDGKFYGFNYTSSYNFTTTPSWANVTKTLNSTSGTLVGYSWYFNDSAGNTNSTPIYVLTTTSASLDCGTLSTANTIYTLTNNVTSTGTCFTISNQNITLDCNGYWINYSTNGNDRNYGVYALNQFNVTIKNCNLFDANRTAGYWSSNGIYLSGTTNSTIFNNFVNGSNSPGIYIDSSSNYNNLTSNTGTTRGSSQGIRLDHTSNYNTLINNTAMSGSNEATALTGNSSFNIIINHTTISPSGRGVYLWQASNHNTFINTNTSGDMGFRFNNASDNRIVDCTSVNGVSYDVYFDSIAGNFNNTFVNCSYNINKETVQGAGSQLLRKWYYQAYVNYSNGSAASNVNITATNTTGIIQFTTTTDSSGWISRQEIIDYNNTGTKSFYSNYTITANKSGYTNISRNNYNLTKIQNNVTDFFTFSSSGDTTPPTISFESPTPINASSNSSSPVTIVANISDASNTSSFIDFDRTLAGYWSMDYYNATGVFDNSTYNNFGTFNGGLNYSNLTTGIRGNGLSFSNTNDIYLNAGSSSSLNITDNITLSVWVYFTQTQGWANVIGKGFEESATYSIETNSNWIRLTTGNGTNYMGGTEYNFIVGQWYHIVGVFENTGASSSRGTLYVNGINQSAFDFDEWRLTPSNAYFGIGGGTYSGSTTGSLDEVMIFNRSLSQSEISALYNSQSNKFNATFTNLTEGQHNYTVYAIDQYGNANNSGLRNFNVNQDTIPPTITINSPANNSYVSSTARFDANINDNSGTSYALINDSSLVGYWTFESTNLTEIFDTSGKNNFGVFNGNLSQSNLSQGKFGQGLSFDGNTSYIDAGAENALNPGTNNVTYAAWFKTTATEGYIMSFQGGNGWDGDGLYSLEVTSSRLSMSLSTQIDETYYFVGESSSAVVNDGQWHLGVFTFDYSNIKGELFLDGVSQGTNSATNWSAPLTQSGRKFSIGIKHYAPGDIYPFNGSIDEVMVFNRSLSSDEVKALYNSSAQKFNVSYTLPNSGGNNVQLLAVDSAGNTNSSYLTLNNDATPPTISFEEPPTPANASTVNSSTQTIVANISDASNTSSWIDIDRSLVGYWAMDYYNSTGIYDNSTYSNFGTFQNGLNYSNLTTGARGQALSFDGVDDSIQPIVPMNSMSNWTISGWINPRVGDNSENHPFEFFPFQLWVTSGNTLDFYCDNDLSYSSLVYGTWTQVTLLANSSGRCLFVNGNLIGCGSTCTIDSNTFNIGTYGGGSYNFNGSIDEVMIFNRSLSTTEILALYNSKSNKFNTSSMNLTSGQHNYTVYAIDEAGNQNNSGLRNFIIGATDSTPPTITFESPTPDNASTVNSSTQTIVANISDPESTNTSSWIDFDRSLAGYWAMDYYNSTGIYDNSTYNNFGTFNGGLNYSNLTTGARGNALSFDGSNDYISVNDANSLDPANQLTLAAWIKLSELPGLTGRTEYVMVKSNSVDPYETYYLEVYGDALATTQVLFGVVDGSHNYLNSGTWTNLSINTWYHVVGVLNSTGNLKIYINGVDSTSWSQGPLVGNVHSSDSKLDISGVSSNNFNGSLDEVMVFNRSLSQTEISALYNSQSNKFNTSLMNLSNGQHNYTVYAIDEAGNQNNSGLRNFNYTPSNNPPTIYNVTNISAVTLTEGPSKTFIIVNFSVYDADGTSNLNNASASINFTKSGEDLRYNSSCAVKDFSGNYANYTCNVTMFWWDAAGSDWKVYANITDLNSNLAVNDTTTFTVNPLTGMVMSPSSLTFSSLVAGSTNQTPTNHFTINNTGNVDITTGNVEINSTDLVGETDHSKFLFASNFSASIYTGNKIECNVSGSATAMVNKTSTKVSNSLLPSGNYTKNYGNETSAQEQIYVCVRKTGYELTQQTYSTNAFGSWTIRIVLVSISVRRKKKNKANNKTNITIPSTIFFKELGALESISKYMKENLGISYHNIAELLNRDDRTIWTAYNKAIEKQKESIEVKETEIFIPISVLNNRELTILESVINYLRDKDMKYSEIAKLINRDQRNVRAIYNKTKNNI